MSSFLFKLLKKQKKKKKKRKEKYAVCFVARECCLCKAEQPLQGMELQEKEAQKD